MKSDAFTAKTLTKDDFVEGFMRSLKNKWYDEVDGEGYSGLFIPAQYGMPNCVDKYGNSDVSKALAYLNKAENEGFTKGE